MSECSGANAKPSWDDRYREGEHTRAKPLEFIASLKPEPRHAIALDLACGAGRHAIALARSGWSVTAVDASKVALEILTATAAQAGLSIQSVQADLERHEFAIEPAAWDLIVVTCYLQRDLFSAIQQGLKPAGRAAFAVHVTDERPGVKPMRGAFLMGHDELAQMFPATNWKIEHLAETNPPPPERARVELVARRIG